MLKIRYLKAENPFVVCKFNTGDTVSITFYNLIDDSIVVNPVNMSEIGLTGYFKYQFNQNPSVLTEYYYIANNGVSEQSDKIVLGGYPDTIKDETDKINRILTATEIRQASVNDASATTTQFDTTLTETSDFWNRMAILFTSGNNSGQMRRIKDFTDGGAGAIKVQTPFHEAPANGDTFIIVTVRAFLTPDIEDLADAVWDEILSEHVSDGSTGNNLDFIKNIEGGKWHITGNQMVFTKSDNITEVCRFNLFNSANNAAEINIYKRERV